MTRRVDFDSPVVRKTMAGTRTVGRSVRTARYIADTPNRVLRDLNKRGQKRLRAYYRGIRGRDGETGLDELPDESQPNFKNALKDVDQGGQTAAQLQRRLDTEEFNDVFSDDVPDETRKSLLRAQRERDISASETARAARKLKGSDSSEIRETIQDLDDAQQRQAYRLIGETGDDGADFITDTDRADLREFFGDCRVGSSAALSPAAGATGSGAGAVATPSGDCVVSPEIQDDVVEQVENLPDDVSGLSEADKDAIREMYENLDESREGGLDSAEVDELGSSFRTADDVDVGPGENPSEVVDDLHYLAERGIDDFVDAGGTASTRYTGAAGSGSIARYLLEETDLDAKDIKFEDTANGIAGGPNSKTDYDVDVDPEGDNAPELNVNGEFTDGSGTTLEDPAWESKHLDPSGYDSDSYPNPQDEAEDLRRKLITQAADGEDELVVVTTREYMDAYGEDHLKPIRQQVKNDVDADSDIALDSDELTIRFTTYEDIGG
ncbi:hypothetical protein EGH22_20155 [Halomicroarcula sp. F28]|uniref:hypothetical protein n=1 Tax=Haloarcula salinisoli TaxID=2487746 RepID=UPI001C73BB41|nr:hypothetical protein [Halomicroarcula salinisoli]MBX0288648.1 hypothetical protein [Halomicroarcula salinisoli]